MDILLAVQRHGMVLVETACQKALAEGTIRGEIILNSITRQLNPGPVHPADVPDSLVLSIEPIADCSRYDALRKEVTYGAA